MSDVVHRLERHLRKPPLIGRSVYIAQGAVVVGDVTIGDYSSVWYNAVLRGDINRIEVGHHSNIQDNAVLHLADSFPCRVGSYVTVGHSATVHACTVEDECLIGIGSTILDGAVIGEGSLIGANALVAPDTLIPPGSLVLGNPGQVIRPLNAGERLRIRQLAEKYVLNARYCLEHRINASGALRAGTVPSEGQGVPSDAHFPPRAGHDKSGSNDD